MSGNEKTVEERVRERAYALWEMDGRSDGRAEEHWHRARSEIEAEGPEAASGSPMTTASVPEPETGTKQMA